MIEALIRLHPPNNWICDIADQFSANIKILNCMPNENHGGKGLVEIMLKGDTKTDEIAEEIQNHPGVCYVDLNAMQNGKFLGEVVTNQCAACKALTASDCFLIFANSCGEGEIEWKLQARQRSALFDLIQTLRDLNYGVELVSMTGVRETYNLTPRQEEVIRFALQKGYFDCPKETNIRQVAQYFDISISTASEILRRGVKKILRDFFSNHHILL